MICMVVFCCIFIILLLAAVCLVGFERAHNWRHNERRDPVLWRAAYRHMKAEWARDPSKSSRWASAPDAEQKRLCQEAYDAVLHA